MLSDKIVYKENFPDCFKQIIDKTFLTFFWKQITYGVSENHFNVIAFILTPTFSLLIHLPSVNSKSFECDMRLSETCLFTNPRFFPQVNIFESRKENQIVY